MSYDREYGALGRIGIVTPQANPTVEPEVALLLPANVSLAVARCTSTGDSRQRLQDYLEKLDETLYQFDTLPLDAVGFACTGSSYLLGHEEAYRRTRDLEERFAYPIISAADAIEAALKHLGAQRIALACPYPEWLHGAAHRYWLARGYTIVSTTSAQAEAADTRAIYSLASSAAREAVQQVATLEADALLITGTGMPTLRLIAELSAETAVPVLSSNLCLAWHCLERAGIGAGDRRATATHPLLAGWEDGLASL